MPLENREVFRSPLSVLKNIPLLQAAKMSRYRRLAAEVIDHHATLTDKTDAELKQLSDKYHQEVINGRSLKSLLVPTFALVREASKRVLGMTHYPVQLIGGAAIHDGHIVEMATGEGKTLVGTCPAYLNALTDRGVHVVTVNDYLAKRDAEEMGQVHKFLNLTVGVIVHECKPHERMAAYRASITYGTNKEIGFDFLRDEIRGRNPQWFEFGKDVNQLRIHKVQRPDFYFAIVDEADSVLIDEARTPLIIAEAPPVDDEVAHEYFMADKVAASLIEDIDYTYDRAERRVEWLPAGEQRITKVLGGQRSLSGHRVDWHESCMRALKAHVLFHRDIDYVVEKDEVIIVDENTGRKMPGRQWEEGLHAAVAAKEKIPVKGESETLARTTYQILFNRYEKLSGMSGTCMTDAIEFAEIYRTPALKIPTNRPVQRRAGHDVIFATENEKWAAVVEEIKRLVQERRAVLVGTRSIEKSELLSQKLSAAGIEHVVLNARKEAEEAEIVKGAGAPGRVTVATNMAGRGTDIKLQPTVADAGGLHVLGTERHESRRVDLQLVGRSGRQGDPGSAQFFVSIEDPLIRRFNPKKAIRLVQRFSGLGRPIRGKWIRNFFKKVQLSIERQHRKVRYQLIKYDRERAKYNRQLGTE